MNFDLSEEQRLLQRTARDWFAARFSPADMRRLLDGGRPADGVARDLAAMGFSGMLLLSEDGGGGLSVLDLAVVAEEAGRVLAGVPMASTAGEAAALLRPLDGEGVASLRRGIASGDEILTVVPEAGLDVFQSQGETIVQGTSRPALDAARATGFLLVWGDGNAARLLLARPPAATAVAQEALDPTRALARVCIDGTVTEIARGPEVAAAARRARRIGAVVLTAEDLGAAQRCLELAVDYAKQRHAFGRPIGSFQAIKHMCVDMFVAVEQLRPLVWYAAWAADEDPRRLDLAAAAARAYAADALEQCAASLIQVHGGIGFTWEHDAHLYWRRSKVDRLLYGDAAENRDRVARLALAEAATTA